MERRSPSSAYDESYADNECKGTDINGETLYQEPSKKRAWNAHHLFPGGQQVHIEDTMDLSAPDTGASTAGDWKQALEAAMTAMVVKRMMSGAQYDASRVRRWPRRQGQTSTGIVLSEQLDFPTEVASCLWLATLR